MSELVEQSASAIRPIEVITVEIQFYKRQAGTSFLEIGRRLSEAKAQMQHGEWLPWLRDQVDLSEVTAQRLMRLANEYSNPSPVTDLGLSKALALLALPASERDDFVAQAHVVGTEEKMVSEMTKRELAQAIRERDESRQAAEVASNQAEGYRKKLENAVGRLTALEAQVEELSSRPIDVAVQEPDPAAVERAVKDALATAAQKSAAEQKTLNDRLEKAGREREKLEKKLAEAERKAEQAKAEAAAAAKRGAEEAETARAEAERRAQQAGAEAERLRRELAMADPVTAEFKALFEQAAALVPKLLALAERAGEETRPKLRAALAALGKQLSA